MASSKPVGRPKAVDPDNTATSPSDTDDSLSGEVREPALGPAKKPGDLGTLGPYRVLKKIGIGGMGIVYLGFDDSLNRKVALKVMLPKVAVNIAARERFLREARASASVEHPNVVGIYLVGEHAKVPFLAMQYLQGAPLDKYLAKKGPPSVTQILRVAKETAEGLAAAHAKGLVHRDIKPANLWLEAPNGHIKILDFGLAKPNGEDGGTELTQTGAVVGTPAYMAPEQARALAVDARTDLYSLGAVLYRLATGKQPFSGPNVMAVLTALATDTPKPVTELNPAIPQTLADLIHKLLEKDPNRRPKNAAEVVAALRSVEKGLTGSGLQPITPARPGEAAPYLPPLFVVPEAGMSGNNSPPAESHFDNLEETVVPSGTASHPTMARASNARLKPAGSEKKKIPVWMYIAGAAACIALVAGAIVAFSSGKPAVATDDQPKRASDQRSDRGATPPKARTEKPAPVKASAKGSPLSEKWLKDFAAASPDVQRTMIEKELQDRHPNYDGVLKTTEAGGAITGIDLQSTTVSDLIPFSALTSLTSFAYRTPSPNGDILTDLKPLAGLPITHLNLYGHSLLTDFAPLKAMPLQSVRMQHVAIADLSPFAGKTMSLLFVSHCGLSSLEGLDGATIGEVQVFATQVSDLGPLAKCGVKDVCFQLEKVKDLSPLKGCPLERIHWEPQQQRIAPEMLQPLRAITTLSTIQQLPAADYWALHDRRFQGAVQPKRTLAGHEGAAASVAFSADGLTFASCGADGRVRFFNLAGEPQQNLKTPAASLAGLLYIPGTDLLATRSGDKTYFLNVKTGAVDGDPIEAPFALGTMAVLADGKRLLVGPNNSPATDARIWQYSLPDRKPIEPPLAGLGGQVLALGYTRDGNHVFATGHGHKTWVWDIQEGNVVCKHTGSPLANPATATFTHDDTAILLADDLGNFSRLEWKSGVEKPLPRQMFVSSIRPHPNGVHAFLGTRDGWISVVDLAARKIVSQGNAGSNVCGLALSPDGATLVSAHHDGNLRIWDTRDFISK